MILFTIKFLYHMVATFQTIMDRIRSLGVALGCVLESQRAQVRHESVQSHIEATCPSFDPNDIRADLSHLFVTMLVAMESRKQAHVEITEGAMSCLLRRVVTVLRSFVFDVAYRPWNRNDMSSNEISDEELLGMHSEAPYLVWILERATTIVQRWKTDIMPQSSRNSSADPNTLSNVQAQLQNTLLSAVFQDDAVSFRDCFREPALPRLEDGPRSTAMEEGGVVDWYKKEVWRIIGWQELRKHIALEENMGLDYL